MTIAPTSAMTNPDIAEALYVYERAQQEAKRIVAAAKEMVRESISTGTVEEIAALYWSNAPVNATAIGEALDLEPYQVAHALQPFAPQFPCMRCGRMLPARSRSNLKEINGPRGKGHASWLQCPDCSSARDSAMAEDSTKRERRLVELQTMPYREYLQTPEWQERRKVALSRAKYRCQVCNAGNRVLNVHHRTYERRGCEIPSDLTVLCRECHEHHHFGERH